ncbi:MAG: glycoside hydrolase family 38 C-terminal domain-containing protein [Microbacterium sp.]
MSPAPCAEGEAWGSPWGTTWFEVHGSVPPEWAGRADLEVVVDLGFTTQRPGFQAEALAYRPDGTVIKGVAPSSQHIPWSGSEPDIHLLLEAASNPDVAGEYDFRPTAFGDVTTAPQAPLYVFRGAHLCVLDTAVWSLIQDVKALRGLIAELTPADQTRHHRLVLAAEHTADLIDPDDVGGSVAVAAARVAQVLAVPAHHTAHRIAAVGHAHIDSAWLWPVRETVRKVSRTFANVLRLMDEHPDFTFVASAAQHYVWVQQRHPDLFERLRERVAEGRFVPVGRMWVESDCMLPSGESMVRQIVQASRYFSREFEHVSRVVWLPDSFGYSAALPQIFRLAGFDACIAQKISWNDTNAFPHHSFLWEGIDGSRILTHFPPTDTYLSDLSAADLARAERQYAQKDVSSVSLVPYGWGDGGGGPTREMLAAADRARDTEGSPRVDLSTPERFFDELRVELQHPPTWSGELYLELHRGTYASQHRTKQHNRRCESLLRAAEYWAAFAAVRGGLDYPYEELDALWQRVLLLQFHDILPGSSISWVYRDAEEWYRDVESSLDRIVSRSIAAIAGQGELELVAHLSADDVEGVAPGAIGVRAAASSETVAVTGQELPLVVDNGELRVGFDVDGLVDSMIDLRSGREVVPDGQRLGLLQLHRDTPTQWDAWDIDERYRENRSDITSLAGVEVDRASDAVTVRLSRTFGTSSCVQSFTLRAGRRALDLETTVHWAETNKLLKLAFPAAVKAEESIAETQFGHLRRPTHTNTSWEQARYEIAAHRWIAVKEPGFGVALANESTYGHDVSRLAIDDIVRGCVIRASLLRAPGFPDPDADRGSHTFTHAFGVIEDTRDAVDLGYALNNPRIHLKGECGAPALVSIDRGLGVIEAVKLADDRSGDLVVRIYEPQGRESSGAVTFGTVPRAVHEADLLETPLAPAPADQHGRVTLRLRPFEIKTLRVRLSADGVETS